MSADHLSMLESGERRFERRGQIEDLANAIGCSVTDLTGQPYLPVDRDTTDALAAVPGIQVALHNYGPDDVPDVRPRSLDELVAWALSAEMLGMMHLTQALAAAHEKRSDDAHAHVAEATQLATRLGNATGWEG